MVKTIQIKLNSTEQNKDNGFYALMNSGTSIACLPNDEYVVPEEAILALNEKKIIYELIVSKKGVAYCGAKTKI